MKNGNILVRKNSNSRAIRITERKLQELLDIQNKASTPSKESSKTASLSGGEVASPIPSVHRTTLSNGGLNKSNPATTVRKATQVTRMRGMHFRNIPTAKTGYNTRPPMVPPPRPRTGTISSVPRFPFYNRNSLLSPIPLLSFNNDFYNHPHASGGASWR